ncbi:MAG: YhhA family cyclophane-containing RiPP [Allosphingosinicella sp.]
MEATPIPAPKDVAPDPLGVDSVVLARLLEEVRNNMASAPTAYNRMHNRHNR